MTPWT